MSGTGGPQGFWSRLAAKPTPDLIVLGLTAVVSLCVLLLVAALVVGRFINPSADIGALIGQVSEFVSSLIALIVGYLAGRGVSDPPPGPTDERKRP